MTTSKQIIEQVAFWHRVKVRDVIGKTRERKATIARLDAYAAVYWNLKINGRRPSLKELGRRFNRHHATILAGLRRRGVSRPGWPVAGSSSASARR